MSGFTSEGQLDFPLSYVLKVIFSESEKALEHTSALEDLLDNLSIPRKESTSRSSGRGRYISISIPVDIETREIFDKLYDELKSLPSVKCAI